MVGLAHPFCSACKHPPSTYWLTGTVAPSWWWPARIPVCSRSALSFWDGDACGASCHLNIEWGMVGSCIWVPSCYWIGFPGGPLHAGWPKAMLEELQSDCVSLVVMVFVVLVLFEQRLGFAFAWCCHGCAFGFLDWNLRCVLCCSSLTLS